MVLWLVFTYSHLMNFLAHFALSNNNPDLILGNFLGDFLKAGEEIHWPIPIRQGILLHRKIDQFTDAHQAVKKLRRQFSSERRRVSGIILDVTFDHLLLRFWDQYYPDIDPDGFIQDSYRILEQARNKFPPRAQRFFHYLTTVNLLASYRQLKGVALALDQLSHRLRQPNHLAGAHMELNRLDGVLAVGFNQLYPDLMRYCQKWIATELTG
ncbi:MAG: ACP phosphodiesterase [Lentisphaeria bacterium]|nr:ACP phosphodiesterase [Candidatus Neomarinimicrobiota bacterium]MCF7842954.1 ACP phosphodiesterase [Lentisphaeria bacterium]